MAKSKNSRFIAVGGVIVIVLVLAIAFASAGTSTTVMTIAQAASADARGKLVEVTGNVVDDSFSIDGNVLTFQIYDADDPQATLDVYYDQGVSATFGNGVTAICKGKVGDDGVLQCSSMVTKCPSKYETATDALTVERLLGYGESIIGKPVKVQGMLEPGSTADASSKVRFVLADVDGNDALDVAFTGAIADSVTDGSALVLTGSLGKDGTFTATDVALEG